MIVERTEKYKGFISVDELTVKTRSGKNVKRELMVRKDAVASIVYDTIKKKFIFVNQWRPGTNCEIIEAVAGTLDVIGEDKAEAIIREIDEEIGYKTDNIEFISEYYSSPGGSSEIITLYYCEVSEKIHNGGGLEYEDIDVIEMDLHEMMTTSFKDGKTIIGINYIKQNLARWI
jgi:ADP-ribose pyrophosphatase